MIYSALIYDAAPSWGASVPVIYEPALGDLAGALKPYATYAGPLCLDMETGLDDPKQIPAFIARLKAAKALCPDAKLGYYNVPQFSYWAPMQGGADAAKWWKEVLAWQSVVDACDVVFPSLYTFYNDRPGWRRAASANIDLAKLMAKGKPVIPFLWPQYHEGGSFTDHRPVQGDYFGMQIDLVTQLCGTALVWGGYQTPFDPKADWWTELRKRL